MADIVCYNAPEMETATKSVRVMVRLTPEQHLKIRLLMPRMHTTSESEVIRRALDAYFAWARLDGQNKSTHA